MARVLVTGGTGFIGGRLVASLIERGDEVRCLVRNLARGAHLQALGAELVLGELTDEERLARAVEGVASVYHLGGATKALRVRDYQEVNCDGTRRLAEACARLESPPQFLFVSSLAAAGPAPRDRLLDESDPARPVSHYGRSKFAAEQELARLAGRMPITIVRPPIVFGPGDRDMLQIFKTARFGFHTVPGYRRHRFSLVHVDELVTGMLLAADRGQRLPADGDAHAGQGCYYLAHDEHPTYGEIGRLVGRALGRRFVLVTPLPILAIWPAAAAVELAAKVTGRMGILNFDKVREARAGSWACSPQKAFKELGFRASKTLSERLEETARAYREKGWV